MNPFRSNVGTLNEILFEKKNKMYGAYAIRKAYGNTVFKSLGITATIMLGGFWIISVLLRKDIEVVIPATDDPAITTVTYTVDLEQPKEQKAASEPVKSAAAALKSNALTQYVIKDKPADSTKAVVNDPSVAVGTGTTSVGTETATVNTGTLTTGTGTLTTGGGNTEPTFLFDDPPSFPGGLQKFWNDNLRYPTEAREAGKEGKVAVNFVLDEEGKITSCKIIKKLGFGCDDEVLRVVKLMPNWKPGKVAGKPVKVTFNQVVDFKLR